MASSYDKAENKKSAHESDSKKGNQAETIHSEEHVGGKTGVRFKLPEDAAVCDHSRVTRSKLGE
jgi:hypothetical protein